jgi:hypothetical protein
MNTATVARAEPVPVLPSFPAPAASGSARIIEFRPPKPVAAAGTPPAPHPGPIAPPLAIIRKPAPGATQSGRRDPGWVLEFEPAARPQPDPLMGWLGSGDVHQHIRIPFPDRASAERFARRRGLPFVVVAPQPRPAARPLRFTFAGMVPVEKATGLG